MHDVFNCRSMLVMKQSIPSDNVLIRGVFWPQLPVDEAGLLR